MWSKASRKSWNGPSSACLLAAISLSRMFRGSVKYYLAHALARSIDCSFKRIQFTSDLLPSDILGVSVFNRQKQAFEFLQGPIFANIVLADEINRTTPKTQSSLLEAMNEAQVSMDNETPTATAAVHGHRHSESCRTSRHFSFAGVPLDRFLMKVHIGYPDRAAEKEVLDRPNMLHPAEELEPVLTAHDVLELQQDVDKVHLDDSLLDYLLSIVERTRHSEFLALGVSTRGAAALSRAAKALAFSRERHYCIPDDIKELVSIVLPHRVTLKSGQGLRGPQLGQAEQVIRDVVESVPVPL